MPSSDPGRSNMVTGVRTQDWGLSVKPEVSAKSLRASCLASPTVKGTRAHLWQVATALKAGDGAAAGVKGAQLRGRGVPGKQALDAERQVRVHPQLAVLHHLCTIACTCLTSLSLRTPLANISPFHFAALPGPHVVEKTSRLLQ